MDVVVLLGAQNDERGQLSEMALARAAAAVREHRQRPGSKLLLTGGFGAHFNTTDQPHAAYLKQYLTQRGISDQDFVEFAESTNTLEDASRSKPIVLKHWVGQIVVVTSDFHEARARFIFEREFADTDVVIQFSVARTDEENCEFDLAALKQHERKSLAKMKGGG